MDDAAWDADSANTVINELQVLLIEDNPGDARLIEEYFQEEPETGFHLQCVGRLEQGLAKLEKGGIDLVLLDLSLPDSRGIGTFTEVHNRVPEVPVILLTGNDDEAMSIQAVRQGAQDYIIKSHANGGSLLRAARYAIERHLANRRDSRVRGRVIGFIGVKGGAGTSTVVLNLAAAMASPERSVIASEIRPDAGTFASQTREVRHKSFAALLAQEPIDVAAVKASLHRLKPGLQVLFGPQDGEQINLDPARTESLIEHLAREANVTLLDLPPSMTPATQAALRACDFIVVVLEPDPVSLQAGKSLVQRLDSLRIARNNIGAVVVRRAALTNPTPLSTVKVHLGCMIAGMIPPAVEECAASAASGTPIVAGSPDSLAAGIFHDLAERLLQDPVPQVRME